MARWDGWLPQLVAALVTASGVLGAAPTTHHNAGHAANQALATTSYYVVPRAAIGSSTGSDQATADAQGYQAGCADGRAGLSGLRVLFFGTQESDGGIRPPGTSVKSPVARVDRGWVATAATGWVRGFAQCGRANAVLALGVNNKADGGVDPQLAGAQWAKVVEQVAASAPPTRVAVTGAMDGEPSWSSASWARNWVSAYVTSTRRLLYAADSADGCPQSGTSTTCGNGWTVADVYYVATGAASTVVALPQIYRTDGTQARQWAYISQWGARNGAGPLRVVGVLSQASACQQRSGCANTANSPSDARRQLAEALGETNLPLVVTDMSWLGNPDLT
jgi:hypothetical protein